MGAVWLAGPPPIIATSKNYVCQEELRSGGIQIPVPGLIAIPIKKDDRQENRESKE
jgi:hypothetical protein